MSHLTVAYNNDAELPDHRSIPGVPREFAELLFPAAAMYAASEHGVACSTPYPLIAERAVAQAWRGLMDEKALACDAGEEWRLMWPDDSVLTSYVQLPEALRDVFAERTSVDRLVNNACQHLEVAHDAIPPPPKGIPSQLLPLYVGEEPDRAHMAVAEHAFGAAGWMCYSLNLEWGDLPVIYRAVVSDVMEYVNGHRAANGLVYGHEDIFNYDSHPDWEAPSVPFGEMDPVEWIDEVGEDVWNRTIRAAKHIKYTREPRPYSGVYALKSQQERPPQSQTYSMER